MASIQLHNYISGCPNYRVKSLLINNSHFIFPTLGTGPVIILFNSASASNESFPLPRLPFIRIFLPKCNIPRPFKCVDEVQFRSLWICWSPWANFFLKVRNFAKTKVVVVLYVQCNLILMRSPLILKWGEIFTFWN